MIFLTIISIYRLALLSLGFAVIASR